MFWLIQLQMYIKFLCTNSNILKNTSCFILYSRPQNTASDSNTWQCIIQQTGRLKSINKFFLFQNIFSFVAYALE
ncbi:MAG: hypothetical protein EAZ67_06975 [Cytophagales bacterium]|nr:MAG: hypothetical protein EAZ67_06975 [Cytophagales bacterium]